MLWRLAYLILVTLAIYTCFGTRHYDDPYITYRYADNLSAGLGFVYNVGERILSTTTPFFTLLLTALGLLTKDIPSIANLLGAVCLAAGALCLYELCILWKVPRTARLALCIYPSFPILLSTLGSELPLFNLLCLLAILCVVRGFVNPSALVAAFATLTRPDGILIVAVLLLIIVGRVGWRSGYLSALKLVGLYVVPVVLWGVFAWSYFGNLLPATLTAKQAQGAMPISTGYLSGIVGVIRQSQTEFTWWVGASLAIIGIVAVVRNRSASWPVLFWAGAHILGYALLGVSRYFWYYASLVPAFVVAVGMGIETVSVWLVAHNLRLRNGLAIALAGFILLSQSAALVMLEGNPDQRTLLYRQVGEWLRDTTDPSDSVGALEIGAIGYYSGRRMIDFAGLLQPDVTMRLWGAQSYADSSSYAIRTYQPAYIVWHDDQYGRETMLLMMLNCSIAQRYDGTPYGIPSDVLIYQCRYDKSPMQ